MLGVLTLLALMGLILIATTHGDSKRVSEHLAATAGEDAMDSVIQVVRETLRRDIWGRPPAADEIDRPLAEDGSSTGAAENNEPFDAPGPTDRWLGSTMPYYVASWPPDGPLPIETDVLVWHRVSYVGSDLLEGSTAGQGSATSNPHRWRTNSRSGALMAAYRYGDESLGNVPILQTPPPGFTADLIPGSTTNFTIAEARRLWEADPPTLADGLPAGLIPRFPYFDTNADGLLDLYDADGDGIPDSPISLVVPLDSPQANAPRHLYAVVRVVDHGGMLNVNTASSLLLPGGASDELTFDEATTDLQRRGRRVTELLFDDVIHPDDAFARVRDLVAYRSGPDPVAYDAQVVRSRLIGGERPATNYFLYGLGDEASLRHRNLLVPHDRIGDRNPPAGTGQRTIDRALPGTLLWSRELADNSYDTSVAPRWTRLNSNYVDAAGYEGYDNVAGKGWRSLLREDTPYALRRPMLTTVSREVVPPPPGVQLHATEDSVTGLSPNEAIYVIGPNPEDRIPLAMSWPVLHKSDFGPGDPGFPDVPTSLRVLPIDVNMSDPNDATGEPTKLLFMRYMASAMYLAMSGTSVSAGYQGALLVDKPGTPANEALNREYFAWQFAANIADYRDSDAEPTILEWVHGSGSRYIFGIEKQPFFTEAYARLEIDDPGQGGPGGHNLPPQPSIEEWFFAAELYVPPYWNVSTADLYVRLSRTNSSAVMVPLSQFKKVSNNAVLPAMLPGAAPSGSYYTLCSRTTYAPPGLSTGDFYYHPSFEFEKDGTAAIDLVWVPADSTFADKWDDPRTHAIDVIGAKYTGLSLAGGTNSGDGVFATDTNPDSDPPGQPWPDGTVRTWSLLRSTLGWRFTTAWQTYKEPGPGGSNLPGQIPNPSLGRANGANRSIDSNVPESVWPTLVSTATANSEPFFPRPNGAGFDLVDGFTSGEPYEAFDSVGEISRMLLIGPVRLYNSQPPPSLPWGATGPTSPAQYMPATRVLAEIARFEGGAADLPGNSGQKTEDRITAGRIDFVLATKISGRPWTWRLLDYLTVQSPLFDGIDNDGDDPGDGSRTDYWNDRMEGVRTLNRLAGRVNINTAPLPVLRSVPFMTMLPTSAEYTYHAGLGTPVADPAGVFTSDPRPFWDLASAIIAFREKRRVDLRLADATGVLQIVAVAGRPQTPGGGPGGGSGPGGSGQGTTPTDDGKPNPFRGLAELANLGDVQEVSDLVPDTVFKVDRYWSGRTSTTTSLLSYPHDIGGALDNVLAPDFRYRDDGTGGGTGLFDYVALGNINPGPATIYDNGGLRCRDLLLARMANLLTTRSDVFTAYIALVDEDGHYVARSQVTLDRSECFAENPGLEPALPPRQPILPRILVRLDGSYVDDAR